MAETLLSSRAIGSGLMMIWKPMPTALRDGQKAKASRKGIAWLSLRVTALNIFRFGLA